MFIKKENIDEIKTLYQLVKEKSCPIDNSQETKKNVDNAWAKIEAGLDGPLTYDTAQNIIKIHNKLEKMLSVNPNLDVSEHNIVLDNFVKLDEKIFSLSCKGPEDFIDTYADAIDFLEKNDWGLNVIPEEQQKEFLSLANKNNWTVAHVMALNGYEFTNPEILKLVNRADATVADICDKMHDTDKFNKIMQEAEEGSRPSMG